MPVGFGHETQIDGELKEGDGRRWNDHGLQWVGKEGKKDGFVSTLTRMTSYCRRGNHYGGVNVRKLKSWRWISGPLEEREAIMTQRAWMRGRSKSVKRGSGRAVVYSDGSLLESGNVGGGVFVVGTDGQEKEPECGVGGTGK